jgi:lysyl-tRNA synthetase class 2
MSEPSTPAAAPDENQLMHERREKLKAIRARQALGEGVAFPNDFQPDTQAAALFEAYEAKDAAELLALGATVKIAGRMMLKRVMGKASFCTLQDASFGLSGGRIQVYVKGEEVGEAL